MDQVHVFVIMWVTVEVIIYELSILVEFVIYHATVCMCVCTLRLFGP